MNIRVGKDISLKWSILTDGVPVPLEGRALSLTMTYPDGKVQSLFFTTEEHHVLVSLLGRDLTETGVYSLTLWENKGKGGQTAVDYINAFRLVANTSMEDKSVANNLRVATKNLGYSRLEKTMGNGAGQEGWGKEAPIGSRSINGSIYLTVTGNTIETVERVQGSQGEAYRCYFKALTSDGGVIPNLWRVGDQAYHKEYGTERTYWRKVVATNFTEGIDSGMYHFVDLSATDCAEGSVEPQEKDEIVQLGYRGDDAPERQVAIILSGEGAESPYIRQHTGIKSYSLPEAELQIRPGDNSMSARVSLLAGSKGLKNLEEWDEVEGNILQLQLDLIALQELLGIAQKEIEDNSASIADALRDAKDALENANAAAIDAADAKQRFEEIADDEIISVAEKHVLRTELARIKADYSDIKNELEQYEVEKEEELWAAYENAYNAFKADLETKINTTGNVSVGNLLTLQDTYYDSRTLILDGIYKAAKALADKANNAVAKVEQSVKDVQEDVDTANTVAGEAKAAAEQAQADADTAQAKADNAQAVADKADEKFDAWAADDVISPVERKGVKDELAFIVADYNDIQNQISKYELSDTETDKSIDNFTTYYNWYKGNLEYVLNPTNPNDILESGAVKIPAAMNANQDGYYAARTVILEKIAAAAKAVADNAVKIAEEAEKRAEAIEEMQDNINAAMETLEDRMVGYEGNIAEINARLDGVVENYFLKGAPTLDGEPVSDWVTDLEKINHVGDTYTNINPFTDDNGKVIDEDAGKSWRWCFCTEDVTPSIEVTDKQGNKKRMHWHPIADSDAVKALLEASKAMTNADGRARTFVTKAQPAPPYDEGDLWLQGPEGDIMVCKQGIHRKAGESGNLDDWEKAGKYVDDVGLADFFEGAFSEAIKDVRSQIDGKAETWYQEDDPSANWKDDITRDKHLGDLWYRPSAQKNYMYSLLDPSGYGWKEIDGVPDGVYDYVDTKAQIFVGESKPSAPYNINDLWLKLVDGEATDIYRCVESKTQEGSEEDNDWKLASYYTDSSTVADFIRDTYGKDLEGLRAQVDGKAETWYQATDPSVSWAPSEKAKHEGDLWYNTTDGLSYIYRKGEDGKYVWEPIYSVPEELYDALDSKSQIFVSISVPSPPYYKRDLWIVLDEKENATVIKRSLVDRVKGEGKKEDWVTACDYATKDEVDKNAGEVAARFDSLESDVDKAAAKLEDVYTKAEADGKIDASEAEAIAQAKAELEAAKTQLKEYTNNQIDGLSTGSQNLLVNSGFTGGFEVVALNSGSTLKQMFDMFSPSLEYWDFMNTEATASEYTQTGKAAYLYGGMSSLSQSIIHDIYPDKDYVLSFSAKGSGVDVYFGGVSATIPLTANWDRYVWKLKTAASFTVKTLRFVPSGSMTIGDIKLEEGTIPSEWSISPYDNRSTMAKFEEGAYLQELLKVPNKISPGSGFIETGVLNAGLIQMGDYTAGEMTRVTAGMSGNYDDEHSVAFFGGGNYAQAITTVGKYKANPQYQPTQEELAEMAKIVLTHGGRAILEDAIVRGSIYAENGYFKGRVEANEGYFKGTVAARTVLTEVKQLTTYDDGYVIGEGTNTYYTTFYCPQLAESAGVKTIYLPIAEQHKGMELSFFCDNRGETQKSSWQLQGSVYDSQGHLDVINASTSNAAMSSYNTVILSATNTMYRFISMPDQDRSNRYVWWAMQPVGGGTEYA